MNAHEKNDDIDRNCVWRFGYGSNIALSTLRNKKNLHPRRHVSGAIQGWQLYFSPGFPFVEPGFAAIRPCAKGARGAEGRGESDLASGRKDDEEAVPGLHGSAFLIPREEADGLDEQERGYHVLASRFVSYEGQVIEGVGVYVPRRYVDESGSLKMPNPDDEPAKTGVPSPRYLRLLQEGAREAGLSQAWIAKLDSFDYYRTPDDVRQQTLRWIREFHNDPERKESVWTMEEVSKHDGSDARWPAHVAALQYVVRLGPTGRVFPSWRGHCVTRRNLLHYQGRSLDANDIRWDQEGFRPLPKMADRSEEEQEYLLQNLESLLHRGGTIVARLKECIEDGGEMECLT